MTAEERGTADFLQLNVKPEITDMKISKTELHS